MHCFNRKFRIPAFCVFFALILASNIAFLRHVCAFGKKDVVFLNIGLPAIAAAVKAYYNDTPIDKAVVQAIFGGYFMYHGMKMAPKLQEKNSVYAWKTKLIINLGASIAESAGEDFTFRMDIGPVWMIARDDKIRFKLGVNGVISPLVHWADGSTLDWKRSLKYGSLAFERKTNPDGTLNGNGSLAYSNANTITTNSNGSHAGHELVHTFQYRRNNMYPIGLGNFVDNFDERFGSLWLDDTAWTVNWAAQCGICNLKNENRSFDILLEKEAYYMEDKYRN